MTGFVIPKASVTEPWEEGGVVMTTIPRDGWATPCLNNFRIGHNGALRRRACRAVN